MSMPDVQMVLIKVPAVIAKSMFHIKDFQDVQMVLIEVLTETVKKYPTQNQIVVPLPRIMIITRARAVQRVRPIQLIQKVKNLRIIPVQRYLLQLYLKELKFLDPSHT